MFHADFLEESFPEHLEQISRIARLLWDKGWAEWRAGNFSINVSVEFAAVSEHLTLSDAISPEAFILLVSLAGSRMRDTADEPGRYCTLIAVATDGSVRPLITPSAAPPTSELPTHVALHQLLRGTGRSEKAILHTHATSLIAMSQLRNFGSEEFSALLMDMHPEVRLLHPDGVGFLPVIEAGSAALAHRTAEAMQRVSTVIWKSHGAIAAGSDLADAFDRIDVAAKCAGIYLSLK